MGLSTPSQRALDFCALQTREQLAAWLGISDRRLRFLLYSNRAGVRYTTFTLPKKKGGTRTIDAPIKALKQIQRELLVVFSELAPPSGLAKGFVAGKTIVDHAWHHRRKRWVVLADLKSFFPSVNFGRVRGAFMARPFGLNAEVATCVAQLCCKDGALPQGAPTSPVISNLICRRLDRALARLARQNRCSVTRYADDICISTNTAQVPKSIAHQLADGNWIAGPELVAAVATEGFDLNPLKFKVRRPTSQQMVTGLVVNDGVSMPRSWRRQVRAMLHLTRRHGAEKALEIIETWTGPAIRKGAATSIEQVIRGKVYFAHWLDQVAGRTFVRSLHRAYPGQRKLMPHLASVVRLKVMAEGRSDLLHLEAALSKFHAEGEYRDLTPAFGNFRSDAGDADLMETLRRLATSNVHDLTVGVFDCDNESFMSKHRLAPGSFSRLGDRVFAVCLASPPHVAEGQPFCVESLYQRSDAIQLAPDGRRLFFSDEFDSTSGFSIDGRYWRQHPKKRAVVVSDQVVDISTNESVLLGKMAFAELVWSRNSPFDAVDVAGFAPTFDVLREVINELGYDAGSAFRGG